MTLLKCLSFFFFFFFPSENRLTFHANCQEAICVKYQSIFSERKKKTKKKQQIRIESNFLIIKISQIMKIFMKTK